jgi:hypothetical protein
VWNELGYLKVIVNMLITYYDEVKYQSGKQDSYWLGGICVDTEGLELIEVKMNELSGDFFGNPMMGKNTEFHAVHIYHGSGIFKGIDLHKRLTCLKSLADIVSMDEISRIYVRIIPDNMAYTSDAPEKVALMYFIEQIDNYYECQKQKGILIGDYDDKGIINRSINDFVGYRNIRTDYARGRKIENLLDTIHFAQSHHSRMLQLADCYIWFKQFLIRPAPTNENTKRFYEYLQQTKVDWSSRSKVWPQEPKWYR